MQDVQNGMVSVSHVTLNTFIWGVIYYACTSTPLCQSVQNTWNPSFTDSKHMIEGGKIKKTVTWPWLRLRGYYVALTLTLDIFYHYTKFVDSRFSHPEIWLRASKLKVVHTTLSTSLLEVIYHSYVKTWQPTCIQNLTTLGSAVWEIWLVPTKI